MTHPKPLQSTVMVGRIAPSPTGFMHVGNARTALLAWLSARKQYGRVVLRIEDIDTQRVDKQATGFLLDDLGRLGLDWDSGPWLQSERLIRYDDALTQLAEQNATFPCSCSRADLTRAASAPHASDDGPRYPGTCRPKPPDQVTLEAAQAGKLTALRFRGSQDVPFEDGLVGHTEQIVDDFVLRRADGLHSYQLAVVVDDAAMGVTEVVRADDLLSSTGRQIALHRALGFSPPLFVHVPMVFAVNGERLAKRNRPESVRDLFARGVDPRALVGALAASAGLCPEGTRASPAELVAAFDWAKVRRTPVVIDPVTLQTHDVEGL